MVSSIGGNYNAAYVNMNASVSSSNNSGKLSQFADKMAGIQENINALVDQLLAEQEALGGMREELKDLREQLQGARQQKETILAGKPKQESYTVVKDGQTVVDTEAFNKATSDWNAANKGSLDQLTANISSLEGKIENLKTRMEEKAEEIDKTKDKIENKKREYENVSAESRRAQISGTEISGGASGVSSKSDADEVRDAAELNKATQIKAQMRVGITADSISTSNANKSQMSALISAGAATSAGIDAQDSSAVSVNIQVMWGTNYAENFNAALKSGDTAGMQSQFSQFISDIHSNGMPIDVNALVQSVLRESYVDTTEDLKFYAEKVQYFNDAKKMTREYTQSLRDFKTGMSKELQSKNFCLSNPPTEDPDLKNFNDAISNYFSEHSLPTCVKDDPSLQQMAQDIGLPQAGDPELNKYMSADGIDDLIKNMEEKLSTIGDDAQLANTDLQNVLQKQQQTIQMMSNISKMLSDTALAIIRKIG